MKSTPCATNNINPLICRIVYSLWLCLCRIVHLWPVCCYSIVFIIYYIIRTKSCTRSFYTFFNDGAEWKPVCFAFHTHHETHSIIQKPTHRHTRAQNRTINFDKVPIHSAKQTQSKVIFHFFRFCCFHMEFLTSTHELIYICIYAERI